MSGQITTVGGLGICLFALLLIAIAGPARAAVVSGSNLVETPDSATCVGFGPPESCTLGLSTLPPASAAEGGARAAIDGVIVRWAVSRIGGDIALSIRLRTVRGTMAVSRGGIETLPKTTGIYQYPSRVPVRAGDMLAVEGLDIPFPYGLPIIAEKFDATFDLWQPALADGEVRTPTTDEGSPYEVLMNATIEPDADGDGYGDESQDACPSVANAGAACPPPPAPIADPAMSRARITAGPKGKIEVRRAAFRFTAAGTGATFECKLDRRPYRPCSSPKRYRKLAKGRHVFRVRSVGAIRNDPTPAKRVFRVDVAD